MEHGRCSVDFHGVLKLEREPEGDGRVFPDSQGHAERRRLARAVLGVDPAGVGVADAFTSGDDPGMRLFGGPVEEAQVHRLEVFVHRVDVLAAPGTECRASSGECDAAEVCDGLTSSCPDNAPHALDGEACTDPWGWTVDDVCEAGVCQGSELGGCDEESDRCLSDCDVNGDADADGHEAINCGGDDCDDANELIYPGAEEISGDEVDQNCDGLELCFVDADGDGYRGDETEVVESEDLSCDGEGDEGDGPVCGQAETPREGAASVCSGGELTTTTAFCDPADGCGVVTSTATCEISDTRCLGLTFVEYEPECASATECSSGRAIETPCNAPSPRCVGHPSLPWGEVYVQYAATCDPIEGCSYEVASETDCNELVGAVCVDGASVATECVCRPGGIGGCDCTAADPVDCGDEVTTGACLPGEIPQTCTTGGCDGDTGECVDHEVCREGRACSGATPNCCVIDGEAVCRSRC